MKTLVYDILCVYFKLIYKRSSSSWKKLRVQWYILLKNTSNNYLSVPENEFLIFFLSEILDPNLPPGIPKPTLARYNPNPKVYVGTSLTLIVNVSGNPFPKITWFKDKKLLDWSNPRFKLLKNDSLRITNAQIADKGTYDYMAENDKGQIFPRSWVLLVDCK